MSGAVARRANAMSKALGGKATFFYALVREFARWKNTEVTVALDGERAPPADARRDRGERPLARRRDDARPRRRARRRPLRRRADRRRDEARLRDHLAEALQRRPRRAPAGRGASRARSSRSTPRRRSRSNSTARSRGRHRCGSRSFPARSGFGRRSLPSSLRSPWARSYAASASPPSCAWWCAGGTPEPSSSAPRGSRGASRSKRGALSSDSNPASTLPPRSLSWFAPWSAVRAAGFFVSLPSASSPTAWSCEITDFFSSGFLLAAI